MHPGIGIGWPKISGIGIGWSQISGIGIGWHKSSGIGIGWNFGIGTSLVATPPIKLYFWAHIQALHINTPLRAV